MMTVQELLQQYPNLDQVLDEGTLQRLLNSRDPGGIIAELSTDPSMQKALELAAPRRGKQVSPVDPGLSAFEGLGNALSQAPEVASRVLPLLLRAMSAPGMSKPRKRGIEVPEDVLGTPVLRPSESPRINVPENQRASASAALPVELGLPVPPPPPESPYASMKDLAPGTGQVIVNKGKPNERIYGVGGEASNKPLERGGFIAPGESSLPAAGSSPSEIILSMLRNGGGRSNWRDRQVSLAERELQQRISPTMTPERALQILAEADLSEMDPDIMAHLKRIAGIEEDNALYGGAPIPPGL